jgi:hypothetical protein
MTGTATDIGIVLGRIIRGRHDETWRLAVLCPLLLAFFLGGVAGGSAYVTMGRHAVILTLVMFGGTGVLYSAYVANKKKVSLWNAMFMTQDLSIIAPVISKIRLTSDKWSGSKKKRKSASGYEENADYTVNPLNSIEEEVQTIDGSPELRNNNSYSFQKIESQPDSHFPNEETIEEQEEEEYFQEDPNDEIGRAASVEIAERVV